MFSLGTYIYWCAVSGSAVTCSCLQPYLDWEHDSIQPCTGATRGATLTSVLHLNGHRGRYAPPAHCATREEDVEVTLSLSLTRKRRKCQQNKSKQFHSRYLLKLLGQRAFPRSSSFLFNRRECSSVGGARLGSCLPTSPLVVVVVVIVSSFVAAASLSFSLSPGHGLHSGEGAGRCPDAARQAQGARHGGREPDRAVRSSEPEGAEHEGGGDGAARQGETTSSLHTLSLGGGVSGPGGTALTCQVVDGVIIWIIYFLLYNTNLIH